MTTDHFIASMPAGSSTGMLLGDPATVEAHEALAELIRGMENCRAAQMPGVLAALGAHCRGHFGAQDAEMLRSDFPAPACNAQEHAAVLGSIDGVTRRVVAGETAAARALSRALAEWFPAHTTHLDSALALALQAPLGRQTRRAAAPPARRHGATMEHPT